MKPCNAMIRAGLLLLVSAAIGATAFAADEPAGPPPAGGLAGAVDVWYRQVLELRNTDASRLELQNKLQVLEAEQSRLKAEQALRKSDQERLDGEIAALHARIRDEKAGSPGLWISLVETELLSADAPPRSLPPFTVVEADARAGDAPFAVRYEGRRFEATSSDFAMEKEILAHLKASEEKMEEEARRLDAALDRVADEERAAWGAHIERLRLRVGALQRTRREVEAAFAAWRARSEGGDARPVAP